MNIPTDSPKSPLIKAEEDLSVLEKEFFGLSDGISDKILSERNGYWGYVVGRTNTGVVVYSMNDSQGQVRDIDFWMSCITARRFESFTKSSGLYKENEVFMKAMGGRCQTGKQIDTDAVCFSMTPVKYAKMINFLFSEWCLGASGPNEYAISSLKSATESFFDLTREDIEEIVDAHLDDKDTLDMMSYRFTESLAGKGP